MTTLADLLAQPTSDEIKADILAELAARSFPVSNWLAGGVERTFVEAIAFVLADYAGPLASLIASWGFLSAAEGDALTLLAAANFETARVPASAAEWTVELEDAASAGPFTITVGQLHAQAPDGSLYTNNTGGTLALDGTLSLTFRAQEAGTGPNAGPISSLVTPLPGVAINSSVLTASGVDEESDTELRARAVAKWGTLGAGSTKPAFEFRAKGAATNVRRVLVVEDSPTPGSVKVFLARQDGTATTDDVNAVNTALQADAVRPLCVQVDADPAVEVAVAVTATVRIASGKQAAAAAAVNGLLQALLRGLPIGDGGAQSKVFLAELVEVLMGLDGARNAVVTLPAADVSLALGEVATLGAVNITWETF